jgi:hypothetical protein
VELFVREQTFDFLTFERLNSNRKYKSTHQQQVNMKLFNSSEGLLSELLEPVSDISSTSHMLTEDEKQRRRYLVKNYSQIQHYFASRSEMDSTEFNSHTIAAAIQLNDLMAKRASMPTDEYTLVAQNLSSMVISYIDPSRIYNGLKFLCSSSLYVFL